ncbi:hypothetical protein WJX74_008127 [Apatococcus lobatus]|uniref:TRUD domain-containing protein n=1 Tax=Apatococcus lobatus TaxID=904363 RepID=A0AAW1QAL5_9CHLO
MELQGEMVGNDGQVVEEGSALRRSSVHVVTAEEAATGKYSIDEVVLPLPGTNISLPKHDTAQVYQRLADLDSISLGSSPHSVKEFSMTSLTGDYRHLLHRPRNLTWRQFGYSQPDEDLLSKDNVIQELPTSNQAASTGAETVALEEAPFQALHLTFSLPSSCYATMLIRELTKQQTSVAAQKSHSKAA